MSLLIIHEVTRSELRLYREVSRDVINRAAPPPGDTIRVVYIKPKERCIYCTNSVYCGSMKHFSSDFLRNTMVNYCNVYGCYNRSDREKDLSFFRLPAIVKNQGSEHENLCADRRRLWLASLKQDFTGKNLANVRVCSEHFLSGK